MERQATQQEETLPILEHIEELRRRLLRSLIALGVGVILSAIFAPQILEWLARPLPGGGLQQLEAIEVTENVGVFMQATLLGGVTLAMPFILYQMWQFVAPGLYPHERRYVYLLLPLATFLFLGGALFTYYVMLPAAIPFLISFADIPVRLRPANYFSFVTSIMFWIGVSFETPLILFFLAKIRLIDYKMLIRGWRVAILLIAVLAAVITPTPDPVNMSLVMLPLILLYGFSILLARIAYRPS
ncbi:MAG TPA: twin-arginine translocase subunit TatC [Chloroflexi bacterium]|nr:twin-arginine translocase subunit TatC [Chloroflexota bacterium]